MAAEPTSPESASYGTTRGAGVSYIEVEQAAIALLKAGQRPSVERLREQLGRGSPQTLLSALRRFWRDLGSRVESDPAALTRLPAEIAELTDAVWQRALSLAAHTARHDDNAARERLARLQNENDLRAQGYDAREKEWEATARLREQALNDSRGHLLATLRALDAERLRVQAYERRIRALEAQLDDNRQQLTALVAQSTESRKRRERSSPTSSPRKPRRPLTRKRRPRHKMKSAPRR